MWQDLDVACKTSPVDVVESLLVEGNDQFDLARRLTVELDLDRSLLKVRALSSPLIEPQRDSQLTVHCRGYRYSCMSPPSAL